eukprot:10175323-Alexandrium_andersonii.AAC.1
MAEASPGGPNAPAAPSGGIRGGAATEEEEDAAAAYHAELAEHPEPMEAVQAQLAAEWEELPTSSSESPLPRGCSLRDQGLFVDSEGELREVSSRDCSPAGAGRPTAG